MKLRLKIDYFSTMIQANANEWPEAGDSTDRPAMRPDIPLGTLYRGIVPFVVADLAVLALLTAFPSLALWCRPSCVVDYE